MLSMLITAAIGESRHGRIASLRHGDDLPYGEEMMSDKRCPRYRHLSRCRSIKIYLGRAPVVLVGPKRKVVRF